MGSVWTEAELDTQIAAYKAALLSLATAQSYELTTSLGTRRLTRVDLPEIRNQLEYLKAEKDKLTTGVGSKPIFINTRPAR